MEPSTLPVSKQLSKEAQILPPHVKYIITYNYKFNKGLLADDKTWDDTLTELGTICFDCNQIRSVFAMMLCLSCPTDPGKLWEKHKLVIANDIIMMERERLQDPDLNWNQNIQNVTIFHLNETLATYNKSTHNFFGLPQIPADFENLITTTPGTKNQYIKKALAYDRDELKLFASNCFESFNPGQKYAYETIVKPC